MVERVRPPVLGLDNGNGCIECKSNDKSVFWKTILSKP